MKTTTFFKRLGLFLFLFLGYFSVSQAQISSWTTEYREDIEYVKGIPQNFNMTEVIAAFAGDFDKDGDDELIVISYTDVLVIKFNPQAISRMDKAYVIHHSKSGILGNKWRISGDDKFLGGKFSNAGTFEIFATNNRTRQAQLVRFTSGGQYSVQAFYGDINNWYQQEGDEFYAGDFTGNGRTDLLSFSKHGWGMLQTLNNSYDFELIWKNDGNGKMGPISVLNVDYPHIFFISGCYTSSRHELCAFNGKAVNIIRYNHSWKDWELMWGQNGLNNFAGVELPRNQYSQGLVSGHFDPNTTRESMLFLEYRTANLIRFSPWNNFSSYWSGNSDQICLDTWRDTYIDRLIPLKIKGVTYVSVVSFHSIPTGGPGSHHRFTALTLVKPNHNFNKAMKNYATEAKQTSLDLELKYTFSPNPAKEFLHVERNIGNIESQYQILSIDGRKVKEGVLREGTLKETINLNGLKKGVYIINIKDKNHSIIEKISVN